MRIFGFPKEHCGEDQSLELSEVTIAASAEELMKIARFFEQAAVNIKKYGIDFDHEHLQDNQDGFDGNPDIQIFHEANL